MVAALVRVEAVTMPTPSGTSGRVSRWGAASYAQATKRRDRLTGPHLRAFDRAIEWAQSGHQRRTNCGGVAKRKQQKAPSSGAF
jgi:hypothetical protein